MALSKENVLNLTEHISYIPFSTNIGFVHIHGASSEDIYIIDTVNDDLKMQEIIDFIKTNFPCAVVKAVIDTHSHADHCGGNVILQKETGCEVWTSKGEASLMEYPSVETMLIWGSAPFHDLCSKFLLAKPCNANRILSDGEIVDLGMGISFQVVSLPGHYIDQIGILLTDSDGKKVFFLGDAVSGRNVIKRYWIQYLLDETKSKASLMKLSEIKSDFYVPGHGDVVRNIEGLSELNLLAMLETEEMILDVLKTPKTMEEILKEVTDRNKIRLGVFQYVLIGSTLRAYLTGLYEEKRITFAIEKNEMRWRAL
ncbi:MAG: MBL fold metallo-hydrolase [Treponema sp.]|nr:MBL fold metallo-hydrolase [Treponema sp.]